MNNIQNLLFKYAILEKSDHETYNLLPLRVLGSRQWAAVKIYLLLINEPAQ